MAIYDDLNAVLAKSKLSTSRVFLPKTGSRGPGVIPFCSDLQGHLGCSLKLAWSMGLPGESTALVCLLWYWKNKPVQPAHVLSVLFCGCPVGWGRSVSLECRHCIEGASTSAGPLNSGADCVWGSSFVRLVLKAWLVDTAGH